MLRKCSLGLFSLLFVGFAFWFAEHKTNQFNQLKQLRVGISSDALEFLGRPVSGDEREKIFILSNHSTLVLSLFENKVTGAWLKLKKPMPIEYFARWAEQFKFVHLQFQEDENPYYFYAGSPKDGQVFKVNREGMIESVTWIRPFDSANQPKNLQALYKEFSFSNKSQM